MIKVLSGFLAAKIVAVYTGFAGVAMVGQFSNFISIVLNFANGAINNGIVKYTAEYNDDEQKLKNLFSTALKISMYCSAVTGIILIAFAGFINEHIFKDMPFTYIIRIFGFTVFFYALNTLLIAILNGKREIRKYTIVNTAGSVSGLLITAILIYFYKIDGALLSLVITQASMFFVTAALITKSKWFTKDYFKMPFNKAMAKKLSHYSLMSLVSILTVPVAQIILRNMIITRLGIKDAGLWQGMMKISDGYLLIVTTALSTYYLPKLSSLQTNEGLRREIINGFKVIIPFVLGGCMLIFLLRFFIIKTLYTQDFTEMESLFKWQLAGDVLKIASFLFGYVMVAKSMTRYYIATEIIFNICYVLFTHFFITYFKLEGAAIAFALNYLVCFIYMLVVFRKLIFTNAN